MIRQKVLFLRHHGGIPLLLFLLAMLAIQATSLDHHVADLIYRLQGGTWSLQNSYLFSDLLHTQAKGLVKILALVLFLLALLSHIVTQLGPYRSGLWYLALYLFCLKVRPKWRWYGLVSGILMGLLFGVTQQARGAHFISHDLWTAAICWFNSLGWYWFAFLRKAYAEPGEEGRRREPGLIDSRLGSFTSGK